MSISEPSPERGSSFDHARYDQSLSLVIDADWRAADLVALILAFEAVYDTFLAVTLDQKSGSGNLSAIVAHLERLVPESNLAIPSMRFASKGVISLEGSGEVPHELRGFFKDLETIGQRRRANKLQLRLNEAKIAERQRRLERRSEEDAQALKRQIEEDELELAQLRQKVRRQELQLASEHLALTISYFEGKYGPDWRSVDGAQNQFDQLLSAGNTLLEEFGSRRLALQDRGESPPTGDGGF